MASPPLSAERSVRRAVSGPAAAAWLLVAAGGALARTPPPAPPQLLFKDLFVAVQSAGIFADSKLFADAVPHAAPAVILRRFHEQQPHSPQALRAFVEANFTLPPQVHAAASVPQQKSIIAHIDGLWDQLTRSTPAVAPYDSLLPLPKPYVVPGGRFREIYYWDSYFTMLGLEESGRHDLLGDMVSDFAALIDTYGHVPNGTRTYYLSRSQPPLFYAMVALLEPQQPQAALARYLPELKREYAFWMAGAARLHPGQAQRRVVALPDGAILNRYWDDLALPRDESYREDRALERSSGRPAAPLDRDIRAAAESGWDFSSRWFADGHHLAQIDTTELVPVDLNSLLFGLEAAIRAGCEAAAQVDCAREFAQRAAARRAAIDRYLWDRGQGAYLDYRWTRGQRRTDLSAATLYPLFAGLSSPEQATAVAATVRRTLLRPGGLVTTPRETGEQWDAPNGWAPLQWIAVAGLRAYGEQPLAQVIACRWMANVEGVYQVSGKLVEKYNVMTSGGGGGGEYPLQDGFGWTNGVLRKLLVLYPAYESLTSASACPAPQQEKNSAPAVQHGD